MTMLDDSYFEGSGSKETEGTPPSKKSFNYLGWLSLTISVIALAIPTYLTVRAAKFDQAPLVTQRCAFVPAGQADKADYLLYLTADDSNYGAFEPNYTVARHPGEAVVQCRFTSLGRYPVTNVRPRFEGVVGRDSRLIDYSGVIDAIPSGGSTVVWILPANPCLPFAIEIQPIIAYLEPPNTADIAEKYPAFQESSFVHFGDPPHCRPATLTF